MVSRYGRPHGGRVGRGLGAAGVLSPGGAHEQGQEKEADQHEIVVSTRTVGGARVYATIVALEARR